MSGKPEAKEKPKPGRLSQKDQQLVFLGAVVGAVISWILNVIVSTSLPLPEYVPLDTQWVITLIVKGGVFLFASAVFTVILTFILEKMGFFRLEQT